LPYSELLFCGLLCTLLQAAFLTAPLQRLPRTS
jgi:hypothetical protein